MNGFKFQKASHVQKFDKAVRPKVTAIQFKRKNLNKLSLRKFIQLT